MFKMKMTYKGKPIKSGKALADALKKDIENKVEHRVRRAAAASGLGVKKTREVLSVEGEPEKIEQFTRRLNR